MFLLVCSLFADPRIADDVQLPEAAPTRRAGELTHADHVNRIGHLRLDRLGSEPKDRWDLPHRFDLPPYAVLLKNGAPADLRDFAVGTHLHGAFLLGPRGEYELERFSFPNKPSVSFHAPFHRAVRLVDDFSLDRERDVRWMIEAIEPPPLDQPSGEASRDRGTLGFVTAMCVRAGRAVEADPDHPTALTGRRRFAVDGGTDVWTGATLDDWRSLEVGQQVLISLDWATLLASSRDAKADARLTAVWTDEAAIASASRRQRQRHIAAMRLRAVPAQVISSEMDPGGGAAGTVLVAPYRNVDAQLLDELERTGSMRVWAAEPTLRTYENDAKSLKVLSARTIEDETADQRGLSPLRVLLRGDELLEGYRPGRTVRIAAAEWTTPERPREERLWPKDVRRIVIEPDELSGRHARVESER